MRLIPGITTEEAAKKVQEVLDDLMLKDKDLKVTMEVYMPHFKREAGAVPIDDPIVQATVKAMEEVVGRAEFAPGIMSTGANRFVEAGMPTVVFAPGNILHAHTPNEYVEVSRLEQATKIYALSILNFLGVMD